MLQRFHNDHKGKVSAQRRQQQSILSCSPTRDAMLTIFFFYSCAPLIISTRRRRPPGWRGTSCHNDLPKSTSHFSLILHLLRGTVLLSAVRLIIISCKLTCPTLGKAGETISVVNNIEGASQAHGFTGQLLAGLKGPCGSIPIRHTANKREAHISVGVPLKVKPPADFPRPIKTTVTNENTPERTMVA